ncbi:hypothetical protein AOR02nite_18850 [Acetobacter orientalis]|uniref:Uncharacterized protein n=1 Tax=Acetobacter orientalis TaxID=146474 RepID=A0A0D6NJP8_9PROT|nr:hypothetical protein Abor_017_120 [Acetobacter orientalis]GEL62043.1 hypothetical protein AOR02nite_18850 [Acetobacter orientalis]
MDWALIPLTAVEIALKTDMKGSCLAYAFEGRVREGPHESAEKRTAVRVGGACTMTYGRTYACCLE